MRVYVCVCTQIEIENDIHKRTKHFTVFYNTNSNNVINIKNK